MMVGAFGPGVDKHFEGESSVVVTGQPVRQDTSVQPPPQSMSGQPTQYVDSQPVQPNPRQAIPNPCIYGEMAFGTPGVQPDSTYRIAPPNKRLQKNMYGTVFWSSWITVLLTCNTLKFHHQINVSNMVFRFYFLRIN
jgi:hypothetical protein